MGKGIDLRPQDQLPLRAGALHINQPLVGTAAVAQVVGLFLRDKRPVHEHIGLIEQRAVFRRAAQHLIRITGIDPDIQPLLVRERGERGAFLRLQKRLAAGDGEALQKRVVPHLLHNGLGRRLLPAARVVGGGVMAVRAVVRAALRKDGKAQARAVDDGI